MRPKSVIDLLREQPEETLYSMRESLQEDLFRTQAELRQVEEALSKKRRKGRGGRPPANGDVTSVTRPELLAFLKDLSRPVTPADVVRAYQDRGITVSSNSIRNSLVRLLQLDRELVRLEDGRYAVRGSANGNGIRDPLFRDTESQSHGDQARLES